jgi:Tn3 transposase DDE domain
MTPSRRELRSAEDVCQVVATVMAYGCNIGPETMARLTNGVSYADIQRITDWHLHDDALRAALAEIVNAMLALDTTQVWGDGSSASSDGQRFLFPRRVLQRTYSHRLGDFALEFYTFISDNYAPFYTVPIECTERDAPYVLDGLLYHESDLDPQEHYTDTHGYIELNFAAFPMFGKRFCPRIRGLHPSCLVLIEAAIIYWQILQIDEVLRFWDLESEGIDPRFLAYTSPIRWDNVILYGEYSMDRNLVSPRHHVGELIVEN